MELLPDARSLKHHARVHFHAGTAGQPCRSVAAGEIRVTSGKERLGAVADRRRNCGGAGDRFIVRQFSPVVTIGGGVVLDPLAKRLTRKDAGRAKFLETLEKESREDVLRAMVERNILGIGLEEIVWRTGWMEAEVKGEAEKLGKAGTIRIVSQAPFLLLSEPVFQEVLKKLLSRVDAFHKENPLIQGIPREELRTAVGRRIRTETFRAALEEFAKQNKVVLQGELVKKTGTEVTLMPRGSPREGTN